jgi:hypothetical protein
MIFVTPRFGHLVRGIKGNAKNGLLEAWKGPPAPPIRVTLVARFVPRNFRQKKHFCQACMLAYVTET